MNWGRKGAFVMLALVVVWTALPVSTCLLAMQPAGQAACCRGMAQDCPMPSMGMNASCCQVRGTDVFVAPVLPYSPEHSLRLAFIPGETRVEPSAAPSTGWRNAFEAPPPKSSPGVHSILRI